MQFWDNGKYGNGCTSVCNLRVQWMYALQNQITVVRASHTLLFIILLVLFLSVSGWGACSQLTWPCSQGGYCWNDTLPLFLGQCANKTAFDNYYGNNDCKNVSCEIINGPYCQYNGYYPYIDVIRCSTQAEVDSAKCAFNPSGCEDVCTSYRNQCDAAKGVFSGTVGPDGKCSAVCDLCGKESVKAVEEKYRQVCCDQLKAPPETKICTTPVQSGPGMSESVYNNGDYKCQDPNLDSLTSERYYQMCYDYDPNAESSPSGGSSGSGGSSDSEGSSGSGTQYPEGCDECPWLDSILDTLTKQKGKIDGIYDCLMLPNLCAGLENGGDTIVVNVDSAILKYITPYLDSSIRLDSNQLRVLQKLDTNMLKAMQNDSTALKNDTAIMRAVSDAGYNNDTNLIKLRSGVYNMDTVMKHRLDSLIKRIPPDVFDSIIKYQDSTMDRIDSALWGKGVGFSLVDSLTDSVVKYFRVSNHYDSVYNQMFASFDSTFKYKMENLEMSIESDYSALGYGDTATSTLRKDLGSMEGAITGVIENLDSSVKHELQNLLEGQKAYYTGATGYGDTATSTLRGDLNGIRGSVDSLNSKLGQGSYDTNSTFDGYFGGYDTAAVQFASNLGSALSGALADSTYKGIFVLNSSSSSSNDDYRLIDIDSAQAALKASNDSTKSALADTMQTWFNELRKDFMLVNFDSAIIAPLGAKVPNTNTCPEDCFRIDLSGAGGAFSDVKGFSWGLCEARIGSMNVLQFIRLILRIVTALTCVYIGLWFVSGRKS